ncbi:MAG: DNA polymerase I [Candidatus Cloacimonadota bacterium]|nr:DNA polymerase I [Candidatus Cloacimonadota bacterium]
MKEKLYIIDGTAVIYRSFYAFKYRPLINSRGENTSAIFGFLRTLISIIEKFKPKYFVITFDEREPTFRHKMYPEYKATRDKMPEELIDQLEPIQNLVKSADVPHLSLPGYEADDIIGTLTQKFSDNCDVVIVSGDKDFYQLVNDKVTLFDLSKDKHIGKEEVKEKFGTIPDKVIDILALTGDSADNVPGIPKVGIKTAIKLVQEFGSLENILANSQEITPEQIKENVKKFSQQGILSKELVTIDRNAPIDISLEDLTLQNIFTEDLRKFCEEYELNTFLKYFGSKKKTSPTEKIEYCTVNSKLEFDKLLSKLQKQEKISVDLETNSCSPINGKIVGISICFEPDKAYYIPIRHYIGKQLNTQYVLNSLRPILANEHKYFIGHNIKFDYMVFQNEGIEIANLYFDTMIASYLLSPEEHRHNLDAVSLRYLHHKMIPIEELIGKGKKQRNFAETTIKEATEYSGEDANVTFRLWSRFIGKKKLAKFDMQELFFKIEMPLIKTLANMEKNGISVDQIFFGKLSKELELKLAILQKDIYQIAGEIFNIDSPLQLSKILFEKMQLPIIKRTKSGYSTDIEVLTKLSKDYEIAEELIQYRQLKKLKSTYVDAFPKLINSRTSRIHSSFNQTVTATGRLSSSEPNLQNIPIRTEIGREMRKGFVPQNSEFSILSADYSQIELRVMAIISKDENLIANFRKGGDVHSQTAALVFGLKENEISHSQRRQAKVINFGIMYGMGSYSLSQDLRISRKEAQDFIENYFSHYPKVKDYINNTKEFAHKNGYVKTIFNRRRYLPGINSRNHQIKAFAERTAINMPIQGTAADIIKIAMNNIYKKIKDKDDEIKMLIQIHDELVFEVKTSLIDKYKKLIKTEMESVLPIDYENIVPLTVDIGYGKNWLEAH